VAARDLAEITLGGPLSRMRRVRACQGTFFTDENLSLAPDPTLGRSHRGFTAPRRYPSGLRMQRVISPDADAQSHGLTPRNGVRIV